MLGKIIKKIVGNKYTVYITYERCNYETSETLEKYDDSATSKNIMDARVKAKKLLKNLMSDELKKGLEWSHLYQRYLYADDKIKKDILTQEVNMTKYLAADEDHVRKHFIDACLSVFNIKEDDLIEACIDIIIEDGGIVMIDKEEINITVEIKKI